MNPIDSQTIMQTEADYVLHTYNRPDVVFTHGEGMYLYDSQGKQYLDFMSGIAVAALGHSDKEWVTAVAQQAAQLVHVSNLYHTVPQAQLAQKLVTHSFADKVYFCNSGAEANEAALKFARKYAKTSGSPIAKAKSEIVAFSGGFHGRTMGALSVTYKAQYREPFAPLVPGVAFAPFNDLAAARSHGLMVINAGENVLRLAPPLIATRAHIDEAVDILEQALTDWGLGNSDFGKAANPKSEIRNPK